MAGRRAGTALSSAALKHCALMMLYPVVLCITSTPAKLSVGVTDLADGNAGKAPGVQEYLGMGSSKTAGFDAHGVYGIATRDGGFLTVGTGLQGDDDALSSDDDNFMNGYAWKMGWCQSYPNKDYMLPDEPDATGCKLQWIHEVSTTAQQKNKKNAKLLWVAESPKDGSFIAVGMLWRIEHGYDRYVVKLSPEGTQVWEMSFPDSTTLKAGALESVTFTQDGGFVVSGFTDSDDTNPVFKSSGQAETGIPVLMKFTAGFTVIVALNLTLTLTPCLR